MKIGCFRAGTYVSFELHDVPFETVKHYDPCRPVLVGGISLEEENLGYIQVKLKRHSWHTKLLKTKDPIIVSVGWRRYQTRPIYAFKDGHGSYRGLNHTPKNKPCLAMFWAPLAPLGTGLAVVQSLADKKAAFRFLGKAYVVDTNQGSVKIVKKSRRTALLKDMCTKIHTTTGICGKIDEPDRIWESGVKTSGCQLSVPADYESFHKTYIDPLEPKDHELLKLVVEANRLRSSNGNKKLVEDNKKLAEDKFKEVETIVVERRKERASTLRRDSPEQLRAVRFRKEIEEPRPLPKEDRALLLAELSRLVKEREELKANGTAECQVFADDYRHQDDPDPTVEEERPPYIIAVQGPPRVGKSLLVKSLVSFYTRGNHCDMAGPIRILAVGKRRIQFVECPNNVTGMIDAAKYADAVIFVVDAGYGFEMIFYSYPLLCFLPFILAIHYLE
ncbi:ribosome biogenesis protein bms1-like [Papaver somniferum]|uniref:ribosome biogenesis protein bms1-like n=1 Tax=Papaver somniferum TaxID=3469 RepID=UPI000E6F4F93|nr:ribosome biogenesis protein bms1-like [Papaver somniferum]